MPGQRRHAYSKSKRKGRTVVPLEKVPISRMRLVFSFLCLGLLGLAGRIAWLQVLEAPQLQARARSFQTQRIQPLGTRRSIIDRNGRLVALDEERFRLWVHPRYFNFPGDRSDFVREPIEIARKITELIDVPVDKILRQIGERSSGIKLVDGINKEVASSINRLGISGLDLEPYPQRVYPQGSLFANVVGFLNQDRIPQAGLEQSLHQDLLRFEQVHNLRRGADGTPLPDGLPPGVFYGDDLKLQLTLDARLQELAAKSLSLQIKKWSAKKGVAIVMNVKNGELLALASTPTYDPNSYWKYSPALFREWSVQDLFEPGSTFKPINLALALQVGAINPGGTIVDSGLMTVGGWPINNHDNVVHGVIGYPEVLQVSSNIGMVKAMRELKPSLYWDWLHKLGLDTRLETDLPGAVAGQLIRKSQFISQPIAQATASFGQGFSLTPIKLAQLHALIANGGYLVVPHITKGFLAENGLSTSVPISTQKLLRSEVTYIVREWMESVVELGSGEGVKTPGYRIAGKTGTAQKALVGAGYKSGAKVCSFVATFPVENPLYVVLVVVDEPLGTNAYGSTVAVPVAKDIIDGLLVLEKIPPTGPRKNHEPAKPAKE